MIAMPNSEGVFLHNILNLFLSESFLLWLKRAGIYCESICVPMLWACVVFSNHNSKYTFTWPENPKVKVVLFQIVGNCLTPYMHP